MINEIISNFIDAVINQLYYLFGLKNWPIHILLLINYYKYDRDLIYLLRQNNIKIRIRPILGDSWAVWVVFLKKLYFSDEMSIKENDVVVDIGAHIGTFSVFAAKKGAQVISYEPIYNNYKLAIYNISINDFSNKIRLFNIGVAGKVGNKRFYIFKNMWEATNMYAVSEKYIECKCIDLKSIFINNEINTINYLKLDCEGAEYEILFSTPRRYLNKIMQIALEYHAHEKYNYIQLIKFLENSSFTVKIDYKNTMIYAYRKPDV